MEIGDTSVKVGVRVRPLSNSEVNDGSSTCLSYPNEENRLIIGNDKLFGFDYVFKETDSQEHVYKKAALPMVENILKGYNATLFAYGQTGSGKTYTMGTCISESVVEESAGIVPRIIKDLFERMPNYEYEYTVKVSFLEIYKEDIHDLLGEDVSASLQIREENQLVKIPGLTETVVTSPEEVLYLLHCGSTKRSVASTAMNLKSSRSHAILTLCFLLRPKIAAMDGENTEDTLTAKLHLVDLAGSERIKKTHAEGDRLKEGIDINRGLLALGNVISALCERDAKKRSHIPYRDSRLTRLLQDSLGGNSATLMLACVSPADINMEETLNTLRYADRARLIKNKPILNRADPKDAELAKLRVLVAQLQARLANGSSCFPLLSPCPKTIIKPLSTTTTTINNNSTNSHFSSELVTNLMNKNKKLESEKLLLCAELDHIVEQMNELYRNRFDTDHLHDTVISELQKIESILNSLNQFVRDKFNEYPELISYIQELEDILTGLIKLYNESNKITNEDLEHAYKQSSDFLAEFQSDTTCFDTEEVVEKIPLKIHTEIDVDNNANCISNLSSIKTTTQPELLDRWGSELRARRLECKQRIETIETTIRQKNVLLTSLEAAAEQGDESYCLLLKKYESQIRELESKVIDLEREKSKLLAEHSNEELKDSKTQREARLKTMEQELNQTRRQLTELSRLKKAKEAREAECLRLRNEIQSLKTSMIRSAKQLKEESSAYRKWRKEKEKEVKKLQEHDRRLQCEMSRMVSVHERQQAVLKRRIEAAAAAERRLKELLLRQKDIRNERDKRVSEGDNAKKFDLAARVRAWVKTDLDIQISMDTVRYHLSHFMDSRKTLCDRLRTTEAKMESCRQDGKPYGMYIEEVNGLTESIQCQTQQISNLQQKLMDAGERSSTDASSPPDLSGQMLSSRLSQLHNIQEARIALKYLFRQASSSEVSKINLETQIYELESQLNTERRKVENLLQTTEHYSAELLKSEENMKDIQFRLQAANEDIDQLKRENAELREASKIQHDNLMKIRSLMASSPSTELIVDNKLSNTPVLRQYSSNNNCTFTLLSDDENENVNPQTNIATDKSLKFNDDVNTNDGDEPGVKFKKVESEWSLPFTVVTDINSNTDADPHQPRCKCRGTCQARCSCKRSGRPCVPSHCHCVLGLCKNRSDSSSQNSEIASSVENSATVMGPPSGLPVILRPKRRTRALQLNLPEEQQDKHMTHTLMNETYDLNKQQTCTSISEINDNDDLQSPTDNSQLSDGGSLRYLWPKNRLSYFPSPLLRSDR
ncbi:unnamed protein product [Schistosoma haematobium]|nr:unnamed protein product [Schistosoma haematobium]